MNGTAGCGASAAPGPPPRPAAWCGERVGLMGQAGGLVGQIGWGHLDGLRWIRRPGFAAEELRVHDRAAAGQHARLSRCRRLGGRFGALAVFVPECGQERQQVARIERAGGNRNACRPVTMADDRSRRWRSCTLARHGGRAIAAGIGRQIDDDAALAHAGDHRLGHDHRRLRPITSAVQMTMSFFATVVAISSACLRRNRRSSRGA